MALLTLLPVPRQLLQREASGSAFPELPDNLECPVVRNRDY